MKKIRITTLAKQLKMEVNELIGLKMQKLGNEHFKGFGKNTWLTPEGADLLKFAVTNPLAIPSKIRGFVIHEARNPRWVYAKLDGREGKVPVAIPRRLRGMLTGKYIHVEAITDNTGNTTYRHEQLGR